MLIELINDLTLELKKLKREIKSSSALRDSSPIKDIIINIKNDPYKIDEIDDEFIINTLKEVIPNEELSSLMKKLKEVKMLAIGIKSGINFKYTKEENAIINTLINFLEKAESIRLEKLNEADAETQRRKSIYSLYENLLDKLRKDENGFEYITPEEINLLLNLCKDRDLIFKKEMLSTLSNLNIKIQNNRENDFKNFYETKESNKKLVKLDYETVKTLFEEYNFSLDIIPKDIVDRILTDCELGKMRKIFETIDTYPELSIIREFASLRYLDGSDKKKSVINKDFSLLYKILRYSSDEILKYLVLECRKRNIEMSTLLKVDGIYKKVSFKQENEMPSSGVGDPLNVAGSFEFYFANSNVLDSIGKRFNIADLQKKILNSSPNCFTINSTLFKKNIIFTKLYGLDFFDKKHSIVSPTALGTSHFDKKIDNLMERGLYNYTNSYRSVLVATDRVLQLIAYRDINGILEFNPNGTMKEGRNINYDNPPADLEDITRIKSINVLVDLIPEKYKVAANTVSLIEDKDVDNYLEYLSDNIGFDYTDEYISLLDNYKIDDYTYKINDTLVSVLKVKRIWRSMMSVYDVKDGIEKSELLKYALTYNSYYTEKEFEEIENVVNSLTLR